MWKGVSQIVECSLRCLSVHSKCIGSWLNVYKSIAPNTMELAVFKCTSLRPGPSPVNELYPSYNCVYSASNCPLLMANVQIGNKKNLNKLNFSPPKSIYLF